MLAFVFPGQGAQKVGMGNALADAYPVARQTFEEADDALGFSISRVCFAGPDDELKRTANSQPAILAMSVAALRAVRRETGLVAALVAGHSLGEYSALVAAGAVSFADAVRLVHKRGRFMQEAVAEGAGAMAAVIGLDEGVVAQLCAEVAQDQVVSPANINGAKQVVVAGHAEAVQRAIALVKEQGARAIPLRVSAPFHCELMAPAAQKLASELADVAFSDPKVPVLANVDGLENSEGSRIAPLLEKQVTAPVRWETSVQRMLELGVTEVVELGPGKVLSGLIARIAGSGLSVTNVELPSHVAALAQRHDVSGGLAASASALNRLPREPAWEQQRRMA